MPQFHLSQFKPNDVWPSGGWSLYQITGDQIAARIDIDERGQVARRDPWCGYVGTYATLEEVTAVIAAAVGA